MCPLPVLPQGAPPGPELEQALLTSARRHWPPAVSLWPRPAQRGLPPKLPRLCVHPVPTLHSWTPVAGPGPGSGEDGLRAAAGMMLPGEGRLTCASPPAAHSLLPVPRPLLPPSPRLPQASTVLLIPSMASRRSHPGILEPSVHQHSQINFQPGSHLWAPNTERGSHTLSPMWGAPVWAQSLGSVPGGPQVPRLQHAPAAARPAPACPSPASKPTALPQHQPSQGTLPPPEGSAGGSTGLCTLRAAPWQAPTLRQGSPGSTGPSSQSAPATLAPHRPQTSQGLQALPLQEAPQVGREKGPPPKSVS